MSVEITIEKKEDILKWLLNMSHFAGEKFIIKGPNGVSAALVTTEDAELLSQIDGLPSTTVHIGDRITGK